MSAISFLPLDLAQSAGVCKGYQNEWQKTLSHFEFWNVSSKHQRWIHSSSLSDSLTSKESSLSFCLICFLLIIMICQTKGEWRDSILCPWKANERRGEMKKKKWKKKTITNGKQKWKIHNTEEYHILWWSITSDQKKCQKVHPHKISKIKHSLCHSFLELILLLTHCKWLTVSCQISPNLPLGILDDLIHSSMTYLLHTAEAFQHILCTQNKQHDAKGSVKMMSEKTKYFPTSTFHTSCEVRYLPHLLGEKLTKFLLFSSFSPHPSHPSIVSAPINHKSLDSSNSTVKMITKHTPWNERNEKNLWESRLKG